MRLIYFIVILIGISEIGCLNQQNVEPELYKITFTLVTDFTGGPTYQLSFKNFNFDHDRVKLNQNDIIKIKFAKPPQHNLMGIVYFQPSMQSNMTTFSFMDTELVGLDSVEIRKIFMNGIVGNRIDIIKNDSILQSISIDKEPQFDYLVGTEMKLRQRNLH